MSATTVETTGPMLPPDREWTTADLDRLPDDGLRYELLDGMLLVTPAPIPVHQRVLFRIGRLLDDACPPTMEMFVAPLDWRPDLKTSLQPDVLVVRNEDVGPTHVEAPLVLAVEVLSPSTRRKDLLLKRSRYEEAGIGSYWLVDPQRPSVTVLELSAGRYRTVAEVTGDEVAELTEPFPVRVVPNGLVRR